MDQTRHDASAEGAAHDAGRGGRDRSGEELRRLLDALAFRAEEYLLGLGHSVGAQAGESDAAAGERMRCASADTCEWCPLCAAMSFLHGDHPELAARLSEHMAGLVTALRRILAEHAESSCKAEQAHAEAANDSAPGSGAGTDSPTVQRIDVQRVSGNVLPSGEVGDRAEGHGC